MSDKEFWLSAEGERRRVALLGLAQAEARRRKLRRQALRNFAANVIFVVMAGLTFLVARQMPGPSSAPLAIKLEAPAPPIQAPPASGVAIMVISTDPTITDRLSVQSQPQKWTAITDDELIQTLANAGQQAGIIQFGGKTVLLPR